MKKEYSVLMAVYKNDKPEYVRLAIESMLNQTILPEQFVIVIDGTVSDELLNTIKGYNYNQTFAVINLPENRGLAHALNIGIKHCRNELIVRMDADDISLPTRCEEELKLFEQYKELALCGCNIDEFYDEVTNIKTSRIVPSEYDEIRKFGRKRQPFNHPTIMFKKSELEKIGGYTEIRRKEDFDMFSRMIASGAYVRNINRSLYLYRANDGNYLRRKSKENLIAAIEVYKLHRARGGCNWVEFIEICMAEIIFYILPFRIMKYVSDKLLRD